MTAIELNFNKQETKDIIEAITWKIVQLQELRDKFKKDLVKKDAKN
jgi:hypothetical protein